MKTYTNEDLFSLNPMEFPIGYANRTARDFGPLVEFQKGLPLCVVSGALDGAMVPALVRDVIVWQWHKSSRQWAEICALRDELKRARGEKL